MDQQGTNQPPQSPTTPVTGQTPSATENIPPAAATATPGTTTVAPQPTPPLADVPKPGGPQPSKGKSKMLLIVIIIIVVLLIAGAAAYFFMHKNAPTPQPMVKKESMVPSPTTASLPTPVITPVTTANVDQTLNNTNTSMQQAVNQVNTDLNSISSINSSQDSTAGL